MIRIIYGCFFQRTPFPTWLGGDMGGLGLPLSHALEASQRQIWEFSTRTLNLFDSTPLDCGSFQWLHINQKPAENAVILWNFPRTFWKPLGFWKEWFLSLKPERCLFETFHAWRLFKLFWCDPVSRDRRVAQKRPITRSLRSTQGQWLDCHDSSSNKANSSDDQNMSEYIRWSSL